MRYAFLPGFCSSGVALPSGQFVRFCVALAARQSMRPPSDAQGLHYNPYFPGGAIAMPKMLVDGGVEYEDGACQDPLTGLMGRVLNPGQPRGTRMAAGRDGRDGVTDGQGRVHVPVLGSRAGA